MSPSTLNRYHTRRVSGKDPLPWHSRRKVRCRGVLGGRSAVVAFPEKIRCRGVPGGTGAALAFPEAVFPGRASPVGKCPGNPLLREHPRCRLTASHSARVGLGWGVHGLHFFVRPLTKTPEKCSWSPDLMETVNTCPFSFILEQSKTFI